MFTLRAIPGRKGSLEPRTQVSNLLEAADSSEGRRQKMLKENMPAELIVTKYLNGINALTLAVQLCAPSHNSSCNSHYQLFVSTIN